MNANLRKVVIIVAVLNLAYFGVEFAAAFVTAYALSGWPDLIVGLGIAAMNADA